MLQTARLRIIPLTEAQVRLYIRNDQSFEQALGLAYHPRSISADLQKGLDETILPNLAEPANDPHFVTLWAAIERREQALVGEICFMGEPNENGEIEIGYGTHEQFQRRGYMTEVVGAMIQWARRHPRVRTILAATEKHNRASARVLENNGFVNYAYTDTLYWWRLDLPRRWWLDWMLRRLTR